MSSSMLEQFYQNLNKNSAKVENKSNDNFVKSILNQGQDQTEIVKEVEGIVNKLTLSLDDIFTVLYCYKKTNYDYGQEKKKKSDYKFVIEKISKNYITIMNNIRDGMNKFKDKFNETVAVREICKKYFGVARDLIDTHKKLAGSKAIGFVQTPYEMQTIISTQIKQVRLDIKNNTYSNAKDSKYLVGTSLYSLVDLIDPKKITHTEMETKLISNVLKEVSEMVSITLPKDITFQQAATLLNAPWKQLFEPYKTNSGTDFKLIF